MNPLSSIFTVAALVMAPVASAQVTTLLPKHTRSVIYNYTPAETPDSTTVATLDADGEPELNMMFFDGEEMVLDNDSLYMEYDSFNPYPIPSTYFKPTVFDKLHILKPFDIEDNTVLSPGIDPLVTEWITRSEAHARLMERVRQRYIVDYPYLIQYDEAHLPEPPKKYTATVDPSTARILIREVVPTKEMPKTELGAKFGKKHWLKTFNANLQFSQAYVSPNWYQGGNNNLNAILNLYYNVKLNTAFHPKWLFENTFQYKLGMNNAPDDELHDYNISEDIFQWNMTVGYKSTKRWYYSMSTQFKTQLLNNYKKDTETRIASVLTPGDLNFGLGMTYSKTNASKSIQFNASIAPLSYNLKTAIDPHIDHELFGIPQTVKSQSEIGSNADITLNWKIGKMVTYKTRLFLFTDYAYFLGDWENTLNIQFSRFFSTQLYANLRYDSSADKYAAPKWKRFMLKEILSIGLSYTFSTKQ